MSPSPRLIRSTRLEFTGTRNNRDLETYCQKFSWEDYDTFLVLSEGCFTQNDWLLTEKVKAIGKSFFLVHTKIDQEISNQKRKKPFDEDATLKSIQRKCVENLREFGGSDENVFLISNHYRDKWDFARLTHAILDSLPLRQKESLTFSLDLLKNLSKEMLKQKVDALRGSYTI